MNMASPFKRTRDMIARPGTTRHRSLQDAPIGTKPQTKVWAMLSWPLGPQTSAFASHRVIPPNSNGEGLKSKIIKARENPRDCLRPEGSGEHSPDFSLGLEFGPN